MSTSSDQLREKLQQEILDIPESRLQEIYDVVHFYRIGLVQETNQHPRGAAPDVMRFAGSWQDMPEFEDFEAELTQRRRSAFRSRREQQA